MCLHESHTASVTVSQVNSNCRLLHCRLLVCGVKWNVETRREESTRVTTLNLLIPNINTSGECGCDLLLNSWHGRPRITVTIATSLGCAPSRHRGRRAVIIRIFPASEAQTSCEFRFTLCLAFSGSWIDTYCSNPKTAFTTKCKARSRHTWGPSRMLISRRWSVTNHQLSCQRFEGTDSFSLSVFTIESCLMSSHLQMNCWGWVQRFSRCVRSLTPTSTENKRNRCRRRKSDEDMEHVMEFR